MCTLGYFMVPNGLLEKSDWITYFVLLTSNKLLNWKKKNCLQKASEYSDAHSVSYHNLSVEKIWAWRKDPSVFHSMRHDQVLSANV